MSGRVCGRVSEWCWWVSELGEWSELQRRHRSSGLLLLLLGARGPGPKLLIYSEEKKNRQGGVEWTGAVCE